MSEGTEDMCWEHAQSHKQSLEDLWQAVDDGTEYEDSDPLEYLNEWPLEIVWERGEPFAVVLGTGGPHVEITGGGTAQPGYVLTVYWASESSRVSGAAITRTGEYFRSMWEDES